MALSPISLDKITEQHLSALIETGARETRHLSERACCET